MSKLSSQCQDELCLKEGDPKSTRLYLCSHHCYKMLCLTHLTEHDQCIKNRTQYQNKLKDLWDIYTTKFDEDKIEKQIQNLKIELENYQNLKKCIENLLSINHFHGSMENNQKFEIAIAKLQKVIEQKNQSESTYDNIDSKSKSITNDEEEKQPVIDYGVKSQVKNNNESDERPIVVNDSIHNNNSSDSIKVQNLIRGDNSDKRGRIVDSGIHLDGHDEHNSADDNETKATSENIDMHAPNTNLLGQSNPATEESAVMNIDSPLDEIMEIENVSALKQEVFQKSKNTTSLEDAINLSQSTTIELDRQSSEDSCY
ncbi:unnamed protein product [Rotaria sordida]|uniref:Uncharacterized protein n=1 Tax=Rotaria sordida TaxID=392033 RepID=A0A815KNI3_9BILA|nr:unnamed protein product [Rotaria sordida]